MSSSQDFFECPRCGCDAMRDQDNVTCEVHTHCSNCGWNGEETERIQSYKKIIQGRVVQNYILNRDGQYVCTEQYFEPTGNPERIDEETAESITFNTATNEDEQPLDMEQPFCEECEEDDDFDKIFDEWFTENENSDILKDAYNRAMDDFTKVTKGKPIPFKDWMRIFFSTNIYNC